MKCLTIREGGNTAAEEAGDLKKLARALERFEAKAASIVERAVEREKSGHKYTNRSGDAERLTRFLESAGGTFGAEMGVEYASYLQRDGWSKFDVEMQRAERAIDKEYESIDFASE